MFNILGNKDKPNLAQILLIKDWVRDIKSLTPDTTITVSELHCGENDCPDLETVIGILEGPGKNEKFKIMKPVDSITKNDLLFLSLTIE